MQARLKDTERELADLRDQMAAHQTGALLDQVADVDGVKTLATVLANAKPDELRALAEKIAGQMPDSVIVLGGSAGPEAFLQVAVNGSAQKHLHAGKLVKALASHIRGGGGGRPDMAQAGGGYPEGLDAAIEAVPEAVRSLRA